MKITLFLILIFPVLSFANAVNYDIGAKLESDRGSTIALFHYRADAFRLETARDFNLDAGDFMRYASIDARDMYKAKRGDIIRLEESYRNGKVYRIELLSDKVRRKKYFVLSRDLNKLSLILPESS
jgi:hypothetical protein